MSWKSTAMSMGGLYIALVVGMYLGQEKLIFIGASFSTQKTQIPPGIKVSWVDRPDGAKFRLVTGQPSPQFVHPRAVLLFFGGNGETLPAFVQRCTQFGQYGMLVMAPELPGYGKTPGPISKATIEMQAKAAAKYAGDEARKLGVPLFAVGSSLGTFSAVLLGEAGLVSKVLLHAPLTSLLNLASGLYWYLPISVALKQEYRLNNLDKINKIAEKIQVSQEKLPKFLILHGNRDSIVPQAHGIEICNIISPICTFINAKGYDHNNLPLDNNGVFGQSIKEFFSEEL